MQIKLNSPFWLVAITVIQVSDFSSHVGVLLAVLLISCASFRTLLAFQYQVASIPTAGWFNSQHFRKNHKYVSVVCVLNLPIALQYTLGYRSM